MILLALLVLLLLTALGAWAVLEPLYAFDRAAERHLTRISAARSLAEGFEQDALLAASRQTAPSFVYRFDEHLGEASQELPSGVAAAATPSPLVFALEFNGDDAVRLETARSDAKGQPLVEGGNLVLKSWWKANLLQTDEPLALDPDRIGDLELRARAREKTTFRMSWDTEKIPWKNWLAGIDLVADGEFHTYTTDLTPSLPKGGKDGAPLLTRLVFSPTGVNRNDLEIDAIRLKDRRALYTSTPAGVTHAAVGQETLQALYVNTPLSLHYLVQLPDTDLNLQTRVGILGGGDPVTFEIELFDGENRVELLSETVRSEAGWRSLKTSLLPWAGREVEIALTATSAGGNVAFWGNPEIYEPREDPRRIFVILEDTERADRLSSYGYSRPTTPFKDRFFEGGARFAWALSQAPKTRPSCTNLMTSLYSRATGTSSSVEFLNARYTTLQEILRSQGFRTLSYLQNVNGGLSAGLQQGVDVLLDNGLLRYRAETLLSERLLSEIRENLDRDLFVYIHLIDPHGPYDPPEEFKGWYNELSGGEVLPADGVDPDWLTAPTAEARIALYDGEIAYNDRVMEGFLASLGELIPLSKTLFVALADHGEHQGERGMWGHFPPSLLSGVHVPLMIRFDPVISSSRVVETPVQLIDVAPTLLELAGIDASPYPLAGESLVPLLTREEDRLALSEEDPQRQDGGESHLWGSVFFRDWHMLYTNQMPGANGPKETVYQLYNYKEDPREERPLDPRLARYLFEGRILPLLKKVAYENAAIHKTFSLDEDNSISLDAQTLQELRAMGYIE